MDPPVPPPSKHWRLSLQSGLDVRPTGGCLYKASWPGERVGAFFLRSRFLQITLNSFEKNTVFTWRRAGSINQSRFVNCKREALSTELEIFNVKTPAGDLGELH